MFYNAFSFYDQNTFLRYNATIDENEVGNSYDNYDATSATYAETLAYLAYRKSDSTTIFVNYSQYGITVETDPVDVEEEEEEEDTTETTTDGTNGWLLASSIAIVIAMVVAIVGMALRPVFKKINKAKARKVQEPKAK